MSADLQCINYNGYQAVSDAYGISAAVRIPPNSFIIATSGQTGDVNGVFGSLDEQIRIAYENVDKALCAACPELTSFEIWKCIYNLNIYIVGGLSKEVGGLLDAAAKKYMGDHRPAGTAVGVQTLAYPDCHIEIQVQAAVNANKLSS